jgi:hypothetical protein
MALPWRRSQYVNKGHELLRGCVAWWQALPWNSGGKYLVDLIGRYHAAREVSASWVGASPAGTTGSVQCGTGDDINLPYAAFSPLTNATVTFWVNPTTSSLSGVDHVYWSATADRNNIRTGFATLDALVWTVQVSGSTTNASISSGAGLTPGTWTMLSWTYDGSTLTGWVNGVSKATASVSGSIDWTSFSDSIARLGNATDKPGIAADYTSCMVYNRALTAGELISLYSLGRNGYPGLLNRRRTVLSAAPASFNPSTGFPWLYYETLPPQRRSVVAYEASHV